MKKNWQVKYLGAALDWVSLSYPVANAYATGETGGLRERFFYHSGLGLTNLKVSEYNKSGFLDDRGVLFLVVRGTPVVELQGKFFEHKDWQYQLKKVVEVSELVAGSVRLTRADCRFDFEMPSAVAPVFTKKIFDDLDCDYEFQKYGKKKVLETFYLKTDTWTLVVYNRTLAKMKKERKNNKKASKILPLRSVVRLELRIHDHRYLPSAESLLTNGGIEELQEYIWQYICEEKAGKTKVKLPKFLIELIENKPLKKVA